MTAKTFKNIFYSLLPMMVVFAVFNIFLFLSDGLLTSDVFYFINQTFHFLGGAASAWSVLLFYNIFHKEWNIILQPEWLLKLVILFTVTSIGVFWEFFEWFLYYFLDLIFLGDVYDTLLDLALDFAGACSFVPFYQMLD